MRGLSPAPGAFTWLLQEGKDPIQVKIYRSAKSNKTGSGDNGSLFTDGSGFLSVRCSDGWLDILELQVEGRRKMGVKELLRGFEIGEDARLGKRLV